MKPLPNLGESLTDEAFAIDVRRAITALLGCRTKRISVSGIMRYTGTKRAEAVEILRYLESIDVLEPAGPGGFHRVTGKLREYL